MATVQRSGQPLRAARGNRHQSAAAVLLVVVTLLMPVAGAAAAEGGLLGRRDPMKASTSREARADAIRGIPLDKLDPAAQAAVQAILSNVTIFRRMPTRIIQCDTELYQFLLRHPDVVVSIWQAFGITQISLDQIGPDQYRLKDSAGTDGTVRVLYQNPETHLVYTEGKYEGPLSTKPTHGRGILLLRTGYIRQPDGRNYIVLRLDTFMQVEPGGAELLTKTFQPIVGKIADLNFVQTVAFVGSLSRTAEVNAPGVERLASKLANVQPEVRDELAQVAHRVAERATELPTGQSDEEPFVAQLPAESATQ